jgi:hypothetical protein
MAEEIAPQAQALVVHGRTLRARIALAGYHRYLSFELPPGVRRMHVRAHSGLPARFGVALFDPRGAGYQSAGFRGSTGAERHEFTVALDDATPGFLAGPLPAGTWTLMLPVFAALPGTTVRVDVSWEPGTAVVETLPAVPEQVSVGPGWYRGDLHCHTSASSDAWRSGGSLSVAGWAHACRRLGLDFAAMTDHNTVSQNRLLSAGADDVLLLAGEEMTNFFHGHAVVAGLPSAEAWIDWRQRPIPMPLLPHERRIGAFLDAVRQFGAFAAAAHPYIGVRSWQFALDGVTDAALLPEGIEVWNARFSADDRLAVRYWDKLLRRGHRVTATGGSDLHQTGRRGVGPGTPTTIIGAEALSRKAIVKALRAGRVTISAGPDGPELYVEARGPQGQVGGIGDTIYGRDTDEVHLRVHALRGRGGQLTMIAGGQRWTAPHLMGDDPVDVHVPIGRGTYARFELRAARLGSRMLALTNPVWLVNGRPPRMALRRTPPPPMGDFDH